MENPEVAGIFEEIGDLLEIQRTNPFRIRAYRNAARVIRDLSEPIAKLDNERTIEDLPGVGKDLASKIRTILETGDLPLRHELQKQVPPDLRKLLNVPGLGPKRVRSLYQELNIDSIKKLRKAAREGRIKEVSGFGPRTEEAV